MADAPEPLADLAEIFAALTVSRRDGVFVMCTVDDLPDADLEAVLFEDEGITIVLPLTQAEELRLTWGFEAAWLTIDVLTALDGVGLTAAVSQALADAGIACNVLAGFHHDHILVPVDAADQAMDTIAALRT
jgi:hypothetical protein